MERVTIRWDRDIRARVKALAGQRKISETDMWRLATLRGLDQEQAIITGIHVETLCLLRRLTATVDLNLLALAKEDARHLMGLLGVTDLPSSRQEP